MKDIYPGVLGNYYYNMLPVNDRLLFFTASEGIYGLELWRSDGTEAGTFRLSDINSGVYGSMVSNLTPVGDRIYFTAHSYSSGTGLWAYDFPKPICSVNNQATDISDCEDFGVRISWATDPGNWNDEAPELRSYEIKRDGITIARDIPYGTTEFIDSTGINDQPYLYQVRYWNGYCNLATTAGVSFADRVGPSPTISGDHFNTCPATSVSLSTGSFVSYQWYLNGNPIAGAVEQNYNATTSGNYKVEVTGTSGCAIISTEYAVSVDFCPTSEVSPSDAVFPLRILKDTNSSTGYYIYFQKLDALDGYNIYEGDIIEPWDGYYHHGNKPGSECAAAVTDLSTGEMRAEFAPTEGEHYYIVTAYGSGAEGPSGFDSSDQEIDPAQSTCGP